MKRVVRLLPHQDFFCPWSISMVLYSDIRGWGWGTGRFFFLFGLCEAQHIWKLLLSCWVVRTLAKRGPVLSLPLSLLTNEYEGGRKQKWTSWNKFFSFPLNTWRGLVMLHLYTYIFYNRLRPFFIQSAGDRIKKLLGCNVFLRYWRGSRYSSTIISQIAHDEKSIDILATFRSTDS